MQSRTAVRVAVAAALAAAVGVILLTRSAPDVPAPEPAPRSDALDQCAFNAYVDELPARVTAEEADVFARDGDAKGGRIGSLPHGALVVVLAHVQCDSGAHLYEIRAERPAGAAGRGAGFVPNDGTEMRGLAPAETITFE